MSTNVKSNVSALALLFLIFSANGILGGRLAAQNSTEATAVQKLQEIQFEDLEDHPVDGNLIPLSAKATSGLKVRFSVVEGPAQVVGSQLMLTGPGLVTIRASQPGDASHSAAAPIDHSFQALTPGTAAATAPNAAPATTPAPTGSAIAKKTQNIVFDPIQNPVLGDPPFRISAHSDSGLPVTLVVVRGPVKLNESQATITGVGNVTLHATQAGDQDYDPASVELSFAIEALFPAKLVLTLPGNVEMHFVRVPPGQATLGASPSEIGRKQAEAQHNYAEREGFLMAATEVTQAQYEAITGKRPSYFRSEWETRAAEQILWSDISSNNTGATLGFFPQLNAFLHQSGHGRWVALLPSDDQWEYACRAGSSTAFNNNTELTIPIVEHDIRDVATYSQSETSPVASHTPNAWGLYDMHGNVAEWTSEGSQRGGSFRDDPSSIRSASRVLGKAGDANPDRQVGFRIILRRVPASGGAE